MKKVLCLLSLAFLWASGQTAASAQERFEVRTAEEFIQAIGSNRVLVLSEEAYLLTPLFLESAYFIEMTDRSKNVFYVPETDGPEIHIKGVRNLTIEAEDGLVSVLTEPRYANVLSFEDCTNLTIKGVTFGHTDEGTCSQGVLGFYDCENVVLEHVDLFGCGTEGIIAENCRKMQFKGTKVRDCSYYIMHLSACDDVKFTDCQFFRNREYDLVTVNDCMNVQFNNCIFANNTGVLFQVQSPIELRDCVILHDNRLLGTEASLSKISVINCVFEFFFHPMQFNLGHLSGTDELYFSPQ